MANQKRVEDGRLIRGPVKKKNPQDSLCRDCVWYRHVAHSTGHCHGYPEKQQQPQITSEAGTCIKWMSHAQLRDYIVHIHTELSKLQQVEAAPNPNLDPERLDWAHMTDPTPGAIRTITTTGRPNVEGRMVNGIDVDAEIEQNNKLLAEMLDDDKVRAQLAGDPELADHKFLDHNGEQLNALDALNALEAVLTDDYNA